MGLPWRVCSARAGGNAALLNILTDYTALAGNRPQAPVFSGLLTYALARHTPVGDVRDCLQVRAVTRDQWAQVAPHTTRFDGAGHGQPRPCLGHGIPTAAIWRPTDIRLLAGTVSGSRIRQDRADHFNRGHTFRHFVFRNANVHRSAYSSMWAPAITDAQQVIHAGAGGHGPVPEWGATPAEARNRAWGWAPTHINQPNYRIAFGHTAGGYYYDYHTGIHWHTVQVSQFYPKAGWAVYEIHENVLEAVGQLMGVYA